MLDANSKEPAFIKHYDNPPVDFNTLSGIEMKAIICLWTYMRKHNEIIMDNKTKLEICEMLKCSLRSLENRLRGLCSKGFLWKKSKELYIVNPECYAYGDEENTYEVEFHYPVNFKFKES